MHFLVNFSRKMDAKSFVKILSNSIVGIWCEIHIVVKLAMEVPEVTIIEPKVC